jgi:hypothetical protein
MDIVYKAHFSLSDVGGTHNRKCATHVLATLTAGQPNWRLRLTSS